MNFMEAVKVMKEGKKVRRKIWAKDWFMLNDGYKVVTKNKEPYIFEIDNHFEATDWEIYEEEDNWNLAKDGHIDGQSHIMKSHSSIRIFIQKVKKDVLPLIHSLDSAPDYPIVNEADKRIDKRAGRL